DVREFLQVEPDDQRGIHLCLRRLGKQEFPDRKRLHITGRLGPELHPYFHRGDPPLEFLDAACNVLVHEAASVEADLPATAASSWASFLASARPDSERRYLRPRLTPSVRISPRC